MLSENKKSPYIFSLISGVLLFLSFPKAGLYPLAWVFAVPLFMAVSGSSSYMHSAMYGLLCGFTAYTGILYWIVPTVRASGEPFLLGVLLLFGLAFYLALYTAVFSVYCLYVKRRFVFPSSIMLMSCMWVFLELVRSHIFTGFPWGILGYTQTPFRLLIQVSRLGGVYAVSFIVILLNASLSESIMTRSSSRFRVLMPPAVLLSLVLLYGRFAINGSSASYKGDPVRVMMLQGNIDQYMKWDKKYRDMIKRRYSELSGNTPGADIVVWPETAVPGYLPLDIELSDWLSSIARSSGATHLVGSPVMEEDRAYNSLLLVSAEGEFERRYDKAHLVPFGEYVPLRGILSRFIGVLNEMGDFSRGVRSGPMHTDHGAFACSICYESIFPAIIRHQVLKGAGFLVNVTNDAWYLRTSAAYQHFQMNIMRAVENNRYLVRSANTGISGIIDNTGKTVIRTGIFSTLCALSQMRLCEGYTFYTSCGDLFAFFCFLAVSAGFFRSSFP